MSVRLLRALTNKLRTQSRTRMLTNQEYQNAVVSLWCYFSICANLFRAETERMNRPATASQSLGNPERKNTPCISDLAGVKFFLKMERVFFFRGSALQVFGQCGASMWTRQGETILLRGWIFAPPRPIFRP